MEGKSEGKKQSGGRPKKLVKRDQLLGVKCTLLERTSIEQKARSLALTVSDFLRTTALANPGDVAPKKVLPKEVLEMKATFNHMAANINQISRRHNYGDALSHLDRATLMVLVDEVRNVIFIITKYCA
jgi:hypothetical protein